MLTESAVPSVEGYSPIKSRKPQGQSSLTQWFRNKSAPGALTMQEESAQSLSSDSYPDSEMVDILANGAFVDLPQTESLGRADIDELSEIESPTHEKFETPPTTPPRSEKPDASLEHREHNLQWTSSHERDNTRLTITRGYDYAARGRKRLYPDPEPMQPPPTRKSSYQQSDAQGPSSVTAPILSHNDYESMFRSISSSCSTDNPPSVSTSFSSISTAWTSPNTSFSAESIATSFEVPTEKLSLNRGSLPMDLSSVWCKSQEATPNHNLTNTSNVDPEHQVDAQHLSGSGDKNPAAKKGGSTKLAIVPGIKFETDLLERLVKLSPFGTSRIVQDN